MTPHSSTVGTRDRIPDQNSKRSSLFLFYISFVFLFVSPRIHGGSSIVHHNGSGEPRPAHLCEGIRAGPSTDTIDLDWKEAVIRCLESLRSRSRTLPLAAPTPSPPTVAFSSLPAIHQSSPPAAAHSSPPAVPESGPPVVPLSNPPAAQFICNQQRRKRRNGWLRALFLARVHPQCLVQCWFQSLCLAHGRLHSPSLPHGGLQFLEFMPTEGFCSRV